MGWGTWHKTWEYISNWIWVCAATGSLVIDWGPARVDLSSSTHAPGATGSIDRWLENNYCSLTSFVFFFFLFKTGLNYNLTADVAKKEKSQQPRVYFVTSGETAVQITEKLQLSYMQEKCEHYLAYVKVSSFLSLLMLASLQFHAFFFLIFFYVYIYIQSVKVVLLGFRCFLFSWLVDEVFVSGSSELLAWCDLSVWVPLGPSTPGARNMYFIYF